MFIRNVNRPFPSYKQGFARKAGESAFPEMWDNIKLAVNPGLGVTSLKLYDFSGNQYTGILTSMDPVTSWTTFQGGQILDYNGSTDRVINDDWRLSTLPFTICAWFQTTSTSIVSTIFASLDDGSNERQLILDILANGQVRAVAREGIFTIAQTAESFNDGTPHFAVAVFRSTTHREIWIDGQLKDTNTGGTSFTIPHNRYAIGVLARPAIGQFFDGLIGPTYAYTETPSAKKIINLYQNPYGFFELKRNIFGFVPQSGISNLVGSGGLVGYGSSIIGPGGLVG